MLMVFPTSYLKLSLAKQLALMRFLPDYYIKTANHMAPLFIFIFQFSLDQGQLLQDWKSANIKQIYKKGSRTDPATIGLYH